MPQETAGRTPVRGPVLALLVGLVLTLLTHVVLCALATGAVWDVAARWGHPELTWWALAATGALCAGCVALLARSGRLTAPAPARQPVAAAS
ncbi:hypothetical protein [Streptomyces sp. NPDC014006]|uniref:hypothetical protein n=1 Tax=Streptomyces sp. NPDC014006 TaxID=3364870 RepID=UPI0036F9448C